MGWEDELNWLQWGIALPMGLARILCDNLPLVRSDIFSQNLPMKASVTFYLTFVTFVTLDSYQLIIVIARGDLPRSKRNI